LTPAKRKEIFGKIKGFCSFRTVELSAEKLNVMMGRMSLNDIEANAMAALMKKSKGGDVMIDLPDRYEWTFRKRMEKFKARKFEAQHKADENYPIVSAASICAKIMRDAKVEELRNKYGDFGSGYPSDEKTRNALRDVEFANSLEKNIRKKWKTLESIKQRRLSEFTQQ